MGLSALHPGLLITGLICVAIPILVHLLRRKHRPISWGAMRFLEQAYKKRRRLITIEQLLLLLTRCAIVALIAGAVGSLMLGSGLGDSRAKTLVIVLDNSIHSGAVLDSGLASIDYQKQRALELLGTLNPTQGDRAALITLASPAMGEALPATSELGLIRSRIQSTSTTDADRDLSGALSLVAQVTESIEDDSIVQSAFILSPSGWDLSTQHDQSPLAGIEAALLDASPTPSNSNTAIISARPLRPIVTRPTDPLDGSNANQDEIQGVRIELQRSNTAQSQSTLVVIDNAQTNARLTQTNLTWPIGQARLTQSIPLDATQLQSTRGGSAILRVSIEQSDANPRDDSRLVGMPIAQHISVGIIDAFTQDNGSGFRPSRWVRAVLGADDQFVTIQQINAGSAGDRIDPTLDILFLLAPESVDQRGWARIARLNASGMPLVITPSVLPTNDWTTQLSTLAPDLTAGPIRTRNFEPSIGMSQTLNPNATTSPSLLVGISDEYPDLAASVQLFKQLTLLPGPASEIVLSDSQGNPLALVTAQSSTSFEAQLTTGTVLLMGFAFDPGWTDLPARPLFVAMMHEMLRALLARSIAPDNRTAGQQASSLAFDDLESILEGQSQRGPRHAGAFVLVDAQGTSRKTTVIHPDVHHSVIDPADQETPLSAMARVLGDVPITDLGSQTDLATLRTEQASPGHSIALLLFAIAAALGLLELLLARRCSYTSIHVQSAQSILPGTGGQA